MTSKYADEPRINWYRVPVDRDTLAELMQRSDVRGGIQTAAHLGLFFVTGLLAYQAFHNINATNWSWSVPLLFLALFIHGTSGPFMGLVAIHELQHRTVFRTRALNEIFEKVYAFLSWSDYIWYQESHRRHHLTTCQHGTDGEIELPQRFNVRRAAFWLSLFGWYPRATWARLKQTWRHARGDIRGHWYQYVLPAEDTRLRQRHRNWARSLLVGHLTLAAIFIATGHWFLIVVFTFGTQYCAWLGFATGIPQHFGMQPDVPDFRLNTRTYTCSPIVGFYYWNMQYHVEHHMYPAVPFYNLPKLRVALEHDLPAATHGLLPTWRSIIDDSEPGAFYPEQAG